MTLYERLGVRVNASAETIRTAYLKKVKDHHPDQGGDPEKFRAIQHAYEVLSNPDRRKRYDETGADGEARIEENEETRQIGAIIGTIMANIVNGDVNPRMNNLIFRTRQELSKKGFQIDSDLVACRRRIAKIEDMLTRFAHKGGGPDFILYSLKDQLQSAKNSEKNIEGAVELHKKVVAVFEGYDYRMDPPFGEGQSSEGGPPRMRFKSRGSSGSKAQLFSSLLPS